METPKPPSFAWPDPPPCLPGRSGTISRVNLLDLGIVVVVLLAAFNGYRRGASLQLSTYAGLLLGLLVGAVLAPPIAHLVTSPLAQAGVALLVLVAFAAIGDALGWLVGSRIWAFARRSSLGGVDAAAGS